MKRKYIKWMYLVAVTTGLQMTACTDFDAMSDLATKQATDVSSRTTQPVTATLVLNEAGTLDAKLTEALGEAKLTVQNLTISGPFNATDVMTLHTLTALEKLDMTNVETKQDINSPIYSITYPYKESEENEYDITVNGYLYDNQIGDYMFAGMGSLVEIKLPVNTEIIGSNSFQDCKALTTLNLSDKVNTINWNAFYRCTSLTTFTQPETLKNINGAFNGSSLTTLTVSEGVKTVSGFNDCAMLKTVNLPSTLKTIGGSAFQRCSALKSITIPEGVEKIDQWAFSETSLPSIALPSTLKTIGNYAFYRSTLTGIDIPTSVTTLGYGVFESCNQLKLLTIPETVTQVDGSLINYCSNLCALFWESEAEVDDIQGLNENCYLYLQTKNGKIPGWGPNWINVVTDGVADEIILKYNNDNWGGNNNTFSCLRSFKAKKVSISINFNGQRTYLGVSSAWRTLVLPFTPTSISHAEKGQLAPFGNNISGAKPFWLRSLTKDGFADATTIEANKPYIIAMPYNPELYLDEYNISGIITFEATDADILATPNKLSADEGPDYYLQPTYNYVEGSSEVYALNRDWWVNEANNIGSVFSNQDNHAIYCFEAYVKPKSGSTARSVYAIDTRSVNTRSASQKNTTGVPAIGDM